MKRKWDKSESRSSQMGDYLGTDSMVLAETYVEDAIRRNDSDTHDQSNTVTGDVNAAKGIVHGVLLSVVLWFLMFVAYSVL